MGLKFQDLLYLHRQTRLSTTICPYENERATGK